MRFGSDMMEHMIDKVLWEELPYTDCVVIGDNSSGKTMLLKLFIDRTRGNSALYFIDKEKSKGCIGGEYRWILYVLLLAHSCGRKTICQFRTCN